MFHVKREVYMAKRKTHPSRRGWDVSKKNSNINNTDKKMDIFDIINSFLTEEKIQNESWTEGVDNNEGRSGFIRGANFVLDIIKRNCVNEISRSKFVTYHHDKEITEDDVKGDCQFCKHISQRGMYGCKCVNDNGICAKPNKINWEWNSILPNHPYTNFSKL